MAEIDTLFMQRYDPPKPTLTVVGSGITGLMSAWQAQKAGYDVTVISQSPDPREADSDKKDSVSSTFESKNDQRYVTLFEGHPYLELAGYIDKMYPDIAKDFKKHVLAGGLLAASLDEFCDDTRKWLEKREALNAALKGNEQDAIDEVTELFEAFTQENRAAMEKWFDFLQEIIKEDPELINTLSLNDSGILRLYDQQEVFEQAKASHQKHGVFKGEMTPEELAQTYPAYQAGVDNEFIQGGAIEMYGLTFGVQALGKSMIELLDKKGVKFEFDKAVEKVVVEDGVVQGIKIFQKDGLHQSKHYMIHPGAFAQPKLLEDIPEAKQKLAAMEGYWITIKGADDLVAAMGDKPNKVHGKQSLGQLLSRIPEESRERYRKKFAEQGVDMSALQNISPIVDFNNMPIHKDGKTELGVGSGYVFKGLAVDNGTGKPVFVTNKQTKQSEQFVLTVMELWLEALHGRELLDKGRLKAHQVGCKRSWTMDDKEVDINYPTKNGGVLGVRGGGNTGDTTKSTFIADYNTKLMQQVDGLKEKSDKGTLKAMGDEIRSSMRKTVDQIGPDGWISKIEDLNAGIDQAKARK